MQEAFKIRKQISELGIDQLPFLHRPYKVEYKKSCIHTHLQLSFIKNNTNNISEANKTRLLFIVKKKNVYITTSTATK